MANERVNYNMCSGIDSLQDIVNSELYIYIYIYIYITSNERKPILMEEIEENKPHCIYIYIYSIASLKRKFSLEFFFSLQKFIKKPFKPQEDY